jgi:putative OPT family oligopeptide transporter
MAGDPVKGEELTASKIRKEMIAAYREMTPTAMILGVIQGVILNIAFVYAALKLGFSIGGSTVAAIMGYAILRGILGKGTSVENNINQTVASGINTAGTGIVFTLPALFLLDAKWRADGGSGLSFSLLPFLVAGVAGALLGVVLIIPLRKQMIDLDRLRFPSGVAVTTIIRSGSAGMDKAMLLFWGTMISAAWKLVMLSGWLDIPGFIAHEELNFSFGLIPDYWSPLLYLSLMNLAAGMLAGRGGLPMLAGGLLAWWVISPLAVAMGWTHTALPDAQKTALIYGGMLRPLGIGALIGGALMGVIVAFPAIYSALRSLASAAKTAGAGGSKVGADEMPFWVLVVGMLSAIILFFWAAWLTPGVDLGQALVAALIGTLWLALAGLIVAQSCGMTDISPMSGMALISVTLMMFLLNKNIAAAMVVGIAVCVAIGQAADMMQDLKTGFMIGGRPIKQQLAQMSVTWIGSLLAVGAIYVLWRSGPGGQGGFGAGTALPAPQASVLMGIVEGLNNGQVPFDKYVMGGILGAMLGAAPVAGLGVLVGLAMYLPFSITLGYGVGCLFQMGLQKRYGLAFCEHKLVPFAAGLIVGEALMGVGHATFQIVRNALL